MPLRSAFDSHAAAGPLSEAATFADIKKAMSAPPEPPEKPPCYLNAAKMFPFQAAFV